MALFFQEPITNSIPAVYFVQITAQDGKFLLYKDFVVSCPFVLAHLSCTAIDVTQVTQ
jgi:hypothetical protein